MIKFILLIFSVLISHYISQESSPYLIIPPSDSGSSFSNKCSNPYVSGFHISAKCYDDENNIRNESFDFSHCIKNYDGNLSRTTGRTEELYTKKCRTDGYNLICKCQQPAGGYKTCKISLDSIFYVKNGRLSC
jgi:hypothetical protein